MIIKVEFGRPEPIKEAMKKPSTEAWDVADDILSEPSPNRRWAGLLIDAHTADLRSRVAELERNLDGMNKNWLRAENKNWLRADECIKAKNAQLDDLLARAEKAEAERDRAIAERDEANALLESSRCRRPAPLPPPPSEREESSVSDKVELLAERLNGREIGDEVPEEEAAFAKATGLVIVFGASDDLMEFRGAINDEIGCYDGGRALLLDGVLFEEPDCWCKWADAARKEAEKHACKIEALWDKEEPYSWTFKTNIPHATFDVMEDGEKFCRGIVFELRRTA